jgi:energy-converting hydrogenase Eha subunit A
MTVMHVWLASLVIATLVALVCNVRTLPSEPPNRGNYERIKMFGITFAVAYAVIYFGNNSGNGAPVITEGTEAMAHVVTGEPNF